jgi:hypothetical protein
MVTVTCGTHFSLRFGFFYYFSTLQSKINAKNQH